MVVGGGIAGLATALQIRDRAQAGPGGLAVRVLEAGPRLGGNIRTERRDGFTLEWGPNGYLDNVPAMGRLVERLGLASELQPADEAPDLQPTLPEILEEMAREHGWCVAYGCPSGHCRPNYTLPLGLPARLDGAAGRLVVGEPG